MIRPAISAFDRMAGPERFTQGVALPFALRFALAFAVSGVLAVPAAAQDHLAHPARPAVADDAHIPAQGAPEPAIDHGAMDHGGGDHGGMDHGGMDHGATDHGATDHGGMVHGATDHGATDHGGMVHGRMHQGPHDGHAADLHQMDQDQMDQGQMDQGQAPAAAQAGDGMGGMDHPGHWMDPALGIPQSPPPPAAFLGPAFAADAYVGADIMAASRAKLASQISGMDIFWLQADRFEYRARNGLDGYLWDFQGFYGGDIDKFWFKSEGEGSFGEPAHNAALQALWSHGIDPWWDVQLGIRQDLAGPQRTHAVLGLQGLAPYLFEVDAAIFLSTSGDLGASIEAELDQRITQRLILQPRAEISLSAQDIPEEGIGAGIGRIEAGVRLRYEIIREFAPYIGIEQEWAIGRSAQYARARGDAAGATHYVAGIRFWF